MKLIGKLLFLALALVSIQISSAFAAPQANTILEDLVLLEMLDSDNGASNGLTTNNNGALSCDRISSSCSKKNPDGSCREYICFCLKRVARGFVLIGEVACPASEAIGASPY